MNGMAWIIDVIGAACDIDHLMCIFCFTGVQVDGKPVRKLCRNASWSSFVDDVLDKGSPRSGTVEADMEHDMMAVFGTLAHCDANQAAMFMIFVFAHGCCVVYVNLV